MATYSIVWAPVLVEAVCDALVFHGEATSGDLARTAGQPHSQVVGVLESLRDAGYTRLTEGDRWMFTQAGRAEVLDELVKNRARIAELEAAIAAPVEIAPAKSLPFEWPDPDAAWPLWDPSAPPGLPTYGVTVVLGGAEHKVEVVSNGGFTAKVDGQLVMMVMTDSDPIASLPPVRARRRLSLWRR